MFAGVQSLPAAKRKIAVTITSGGFIHVVLVIAFGAVLLGIISGRGLL